MRFFCVNQNKMSQNIKQANQICKHLALYFYLWRLLNHNFTSKYLLIKK